MGLWRVCIVSKWLLMKMCTLCVMCSRMVALFVCLAMLCGGECVCGCGMWVVQYVMGSGRVLIFPARFVRGELGEFSILGDDGKWSEACGIIWVIFCRFVVAKTR